MSTLFIPRNRRTTNLAADALLNAGGALHQPSQCQSFAALSGQHHAQHWYEARFNPMTVFYVSSAATFVITLLEHHPDKKI